jgi:hypothetical protein
MTDEVEDGVPDGADIPDENTDPNANRSVDAEESET